MGAHDSSNGFISTVWGPSIWFVLHFVSYLPAEQDRPELDTLIQGLSSVLPCGACRVNIDAAISRTPTRKDRAEFLYHLHATVNAGVHGPQYVAPPEPEVRELYTTIANTPTASVCMHVQPRSKRGRPCSLPVIVGGRSVHRTPVICHPLLQPAVFALYVVALNYHPDRAGGYQVWIEALLRIVCRVTGYHQSLPKGALASRATVVEWVRNIYPVADLYPRDPRFYEQFRATTCTPASSTREGTCATRVPVVCTLRVECGTPGKRILVDGGCGLTPVS
jgi:hypothetical protein